MKKVKLKKSHIHAGVSHSAGDVIEVSDTDAAFIELQSIGVVISEKSVETQSTETKVEEENTENQGATENE